MYLGRIVESAPDVELDTNPRHPYTQALLSAVPDPDPDVRKKRIILTGDVPSPIAPPPGCHFHTRCGVSEDVCVTAVPELVDIGAEHYVACHLVSPVS
jgi:peptide/nickel transport system ATP-binding protein